MTLAPTGPRAVRWREGFRAAVILLELATAAVFVGGFWWIDANMKDQIALERHAARVEGEVVRATIPLRYSFQVGGKRWRGETEVSPTRLATTPVGAPVTVYYLPDNPTISTIDPGVPGRAEIERDGRRLQVFLCGIALGLFVVGLRVAARRQRAILREWPAIPAKVLGRHERQAPGGHASGFFTVDLELAGEPPTELHRTVGSAASIGLLPGVATSVLRHPMKPETYLLPNELLFVEPIPQEPA